MNLEVILSPDPERYRVYEVRVNHRAPTSAEIASWCSFGITRSAIITCFADVRNFSNEIIKDVHTKHGPYFFKLHIRAPGKPFMEYEMPHGDMILEDRLWIPIDMHEAFYVEVT